MINKYYHISFSYQENKVRGVLHGRCVIPLTMEPTTNEHLIALEQYISEKFKIKKTVILNWQLLREEYVPDTKSPSTKTVVENERENADG